MKNRTILTAFLFSILATLSSCEFIGGIFKAGMGVGIFIVVFVIALVVFIISKTSRNK